MLFVSFKVSVSQHYWKLSFKRIFHNMSFFFFFQFLDDPELLFIAWPVFPGKNNRNETRDKCWWPGVHVGGTVTPPVTGKA